MKISLDEVESLLNIIERINISDKRELIYAGAGIKHLYRGYKPGNKDRIYLDDARIDLYVVYREDNEEYLTKLTQKVGYSTIKYSNSAFRVEDLYDANIKIKSLEKWEMNAQLKEFVKNWNELHSNRRIRYFTNIDTIEAINKDISKFKETVIFSKYRSEDMTKVEYLTNFMYYIENEYGNISSNNIEKYGLDEFDDIDFIGWLLKSNKMGEYLQWRSEKTLLGDCIIQLEDGCINPNLIKNLEEDKNIRELKIKFTR